MKNVKKALSLLLSILLVFCVASVGFTATYAVETYSAGDIIEYGTYPQSRVTDETTLDTLNNKLIDDRWIRYAYYSGTELWYDGNMQLGDFMKFQDVTVAGVKYRAVSFERYRPYLTGYSSSESNSYQDENGFATNKVYWFSFEPLEWRVLDPSDGLSMCNLIIDSQPYNNYILSADSEYWGDSDQTYYSSNYVKSSIREWLNNDFFYTAFSEKQRSNIKTTTLNNDGYHTLTGTTGYERYDAPSTNDKIFLLSYNEVTNSYGFGSYNFANKKRRLKGSDYANCQGLYVDRDSGSIDNGNSFWWLRSSCFSGYARHVDTAGSVTSSGGVGATKTGIVPACKLNNLKSDPTGASLYKTGDIIEYGTYPQSRVTDETTLAILSSKLSDDRWISYGYYSGTGSEYDGQMQPGDWMKYQDIISGGVQYRAVYFTAYRPFRAGYACTASYSKQDDNGYIKDSIYWFKYEPLEWRVIDPEDGLIFCESSIDSQAYNNYILKSDNELWGNEYKTYYANNYSQSSIRQWLNDDFINTAFSFSQQTNIKTVALNNYASSSDFSQYDSAVTIDKIFLLSYAEAMNTAYGFSSSTGSDAVRQASGTDYAKCQGIYEFSNGNTYWRLRSPGDDSDHSCTVSNGGSVSSIYGTDFIYYGVRPALKLDNLKDDPTGAMILADYTVLDYLIASIPENLSIYTDSSVAALNDIIEGIDRDLLITEQATVDGYVEALSVALDGLYLEPVASVNGNQIIRGQRATWSVTTPDDVVWLRFTDNYTTVLGSTGSQVISCKYNSSNIGSTEISVSDENGIRMWTVSIPITYPGASVSATEIWSIEYKRSGSSVWEPVNNPGETGNKTAYAEEILVGKNSDVFTPPTPSYEKYTIVSAQADKENETFTVVTTDDVSKIRISYTNAETGKVKSAAYQATSTSVISCESENGFTTWVVKYKFNAPAENNTYTVQARGPAWGETTSVTV